MRDYVKSRPAKVGEKLRTQHFFHPGTVGFAAPEDAIMAVRPTGSNQWQKCVANYAAKVFVVCNASIRAMIMT
jgi:hypothetical protein